ncbi:uncharacterized protein LOC119310208 [Triticum dicoccoides]|uniref:uncharacterized protein LOC119310208 n=1 Tax=Triticum dicoccoides TaxID=85692 RepID=UPI0018914D44|nr:uncharacterized protein LOC119310208 [Triticum dicoccoides]
MSSWFLTSLFIKRILLLVRKSSRGIKVYSNLRGGWARLLTRSRLYRQRERQSRPWAQLGRAITSASDSNSSRIRGIVVVVAEGVGQELIAGTDDKNGEQDEKKMHGQVSHHDNHVFKLAKKIQPCQLYSLIIVAIFSN